MQLLNAMLYTFALIVSLLVVICSGSLLAILFLNCWPSCPVCSPPNDSASDALCFMFLDWSMYFWATVSDLCPGVCNVLNSVRFLKLLPLYFNSVRN